MELESVRIEWLAADSLYAQMAGPAFVEAAEDPVVVRVVTSRPLGNLTRTSSPLIVLNGERLMYTWAHGPRILVAFRPDLGWLRDANTVSVEWLGDEERTRTREPLTFTREQVERWLDRVVGMD